MTKTSVGRVRSIKMNLAHYDGILVKKKLAFQAAPTELWKVAIAKISISDEGY